MMPPNDDQATLALVLGIIGCIFCWFLGPVALFIGNSSRQRIANSGGTLGGAGLATAGMILGIIGTVLLVFGVIIIILLIVAAISANPRPTG